MEKTTQKSMSKKGLKNNGETNLDEAAGAASGVHLQCLLLAEVALELLDYLSGHFDDTDDLVNEVKPKIESILR